MIALRLLKSFGIWNAGEIAGFPEGEASRLVASGVAEQLTEQPPVANEPKPVAEMAVAELKALAEAEGIDLGGAGKKAEIVEAIEKARAPVTT